MPDEEAQTVLILGDIHGRFQEAERLYNSIRRVYSPLEIDLLIQVGDFGFWPQSGDVDPWTLELDHRAVFVDGNHERHDILQSDQFEEPNLGLDPYHSYKAGDWTRCMKDIWEYKSRGSIEDGILYIGGASSIDKHMRTAGQDWFSDEDIQYGQKMRTMENIDEYGPENIHTVISHEAPAGFDLSEACHKEEIKDDSNRRFLQDVLKKVEPDRWYFGHYHGKLSGSYAETSWRCIDMIYRDSDRDDWVITELPV
jgi:hypothetical protein